MRLTTITHVSVDGVMQGLGGPEEDRQDGFERAGWALPLFDDDAEAFLGGIFERADAFLLGRRTYESFAGSWGAIAEMADSPIGRTLNARPKYLVSATLTDPRWTATTVLSGDLATAVRDLRNGPAGELQVHGSLTLVRWLLHNRLVDEITLLTYPVIVGQGARLFPDTGPDAALDLVDSRTFPNGITSRVYRPAGSPRYAGGTADADHAGFADTP
ncbi:dihydrofolate reductase family protein [Nocardia rhamnosiphila]|uniref:dihydrofolate reductase family protein n=1 Tax=Nocardia rhamnosiphila TaxID=426716 RepID=UPI00378D6809